MTEIDSVPCALCEDRVHLDQPYCRLSVEFVQYFAGTRETEYVAHIECVDNLTEPDP